MVLGSEGRKSARLDTGKRKRSASASSCPYRVSSVGLTMKWDSFSDTVSMECIV